MAKEYHTKGKEILIAYFESLNGKRFSAKDIIDYMEKSGQSINQATIYRNLDKLSNEGTLIKTKQPDEDFSYYQYVGANQKCLEHLHMQCKKCGRIVHLEGPTFVSFYKRIKIEYGFILEPKESVIVGICPNCR